MTFRFIHSGDLHLGKHFGRFTDDLPARVREARHAVIGRLAEHAHAPMADDPACTRHVRHGNPCT